MLNSQKFSRLVIFIIYAWFGALKILGLSAADALVRRMHDEVATFMPFSSFFIALGVFEVIIGILFLLPRFTRLAKSIFALHMIAVFLPLILLPDLTWQSTFIPTLEGQYIIKNLALIALVLGLSRS